MATVFPTTLDTYVNPQPTDVRTGHAVQHQNHNDAITALEAKVGINSSAVTTTLDYKLSGIPAGDKAVSLTGTETLTNKTLSSPQIKIGNNFGLQIQQYDMNAVNYPFVQNSPTGQAVGFGGSGSDANVSVNLLPKGTGAVFIYTATGTTPSIGAGGADANQNLNLNSRGTGTVTANGITVADISTAQTLTNKTLTAPVIKQYSGWQPDPNTWTYGSTDGNTFTATVNANITNVIEPGDRVQLTQAKLTPTAYYRFESGAITTDSAGTYTLTNNNAATNAAGMFGQGVDFGTANTNKYLSTTNTLGIDGGTFSVALWVNLDTEISSGTYTFFDQMSNTSKVEYQISYSYNSGTRVLNFLRNRVGVAVDTASATVTLGTSSWHHIAMVYDTTTNLIRAYLDGVLVATVSSTGSGSAVSTNGISIGAVTTAGNFASAKIDDCVIFAGTKLSADEVRQLYNNGTGLEYNSAINFTKNFIVTATPTWNGTSTTVTLYGGSNGRLDNATISSPQYSHVKSPYGFPLDLNIWTEITKNTTTGTNNSPPNNTWYVPQTIQLIIPIGLWRTIYRVTARGQTAASNYISQKVTLSTATNAETDNDFTSSADAEVANTTSPIFGSEMSLSAEKTLNLATKTTYNLLHYINAGTVGPNGIGFKGGDSPTIVKAICAYL